MLHGGLIPLNSMLHATQSEAHHLLQYTYIIMF